MNKLHVHKKYTVNSPSGYNGVIATYNLDNGSTLKIWANDDIFWLNEFRPDSVMTTAQFKHTKNYDDAIKLLINMGEQINNQLTPKPNRA